MTSAFGFRQGAEPMIDTAKHGLFVKMFSGALASQILLSGTSFLASLLLIRRTSDLQYGYYILVSGIILLAGSLQNAFIAPSMINRMTRLDRPACGDITGGLYREQRYLIIIVAAAAIALSCALRIFNLIDDALLLLVLATIVTTATAMRREYFRMVLLAYRRSTDVLSGDLAFTALLTLGVLLATLSPYPAAFAVLAFGVAAFFASVLLSRTLRRNEAWNPNGAQGIMRQIAPLGTWSTAGAAIHWSFSQGYNYLVAGTLDLSALAAIASTRLLAMPANLLSSGIGSLMLPLTSRWLHDNDSRFVLRRLFWFAMVIGTISLCYFVTLWILRDWIFDVVLKKNFPQRDLLLMLWSAIFVLMAFDQQLLYLLVVREKFRSLTGLALLSAAVALAFSYWGIRRMGSAGAPLGVLVGEMINTVGIVYLCLRETAFPDAMPRAPAEAIP